MRKVVDDGARRPDVRVRTVPDPGRTIRARLTAVTETGLTLLKGRNEISVRSEDVHSIRIFPVRTQNRKNRRIAAIFAVPIGIGTCLGTFVLTALTTGGIPEGGYGHGPSIGFMAAGVTVPYLVYRRAWNADRGSILIYRVRIQLASCSGGAFGGGFAGLKGSIPCGACLAHARFRRRSSAFRLVRCNWGGPSGS